MRAAFTLIQICCSKKLKSVKANAGPSITFVDGAIARLKAFKKARQFSKIYNSF
jgi:hypothetical protein